MTNQEIIFRTSLQLCNKGVIKGTGEFISVVETDTDGNEITKQYEMPEAIHTYSIWKSQGRQVKKGEKAKAQIPIWKYKGRVTEIETTNENNETTTEEIETGRMFMKTAFFFTFDQTEPITN